MTERATRRGIARRALGSRAWLGGGEDARNEDGGRERGERIEEAANSHCLLSPRRNAAARSPKYSQNAAPPAHRCPAAVATGSPPSPAQWSETEIAALEWLFAGLLILQYKRRKYCTHTSTRPHCLRYNTYRTMAQLTAQAVRSDPVIRMY